ncbi:MAG: hypothetical protein WC889_10910 [Myxococcota bacterium]
MKIEIAVTPPPGSESHPGLQILAAAGDVVFPLGGSYDTATGKLTAVVTGLPPDSYVVAAFNDGIVRVTSVDIAQNFQKSVAGVGAGGWATVDWTLDYDSQTFTEDQEKKLLGYAKQAATVYSQFGFKEPFLYMETVKKSKVWHLHLIDNKKFSFFDKTADPKAINAAGRYGGIYFDKSAIDRPENFNVGDGQFVIAHELFHAIFASYKITYIYLMSAAKNKYETSVGFNEGIATAAGYWIDKGSPLNPLPGIKKSNLSSALGYFNPEDYSTTYQNQDFYVYLLRIGTLSDIRKHLEGLAKADVKKTTTNLGWALAEYSTALNSYSTGFKDDFSGMYSLYISDRGYQRTPDGFLWPDEPDGEKPGTQYYFAEELFKDNTQLEIEGRACKKAGDNAVCTLHFVPTFPLMGVEIHSDLLSIMKWLDLALGDTYSGTFSLKSENGKVRFAVFGEKDRLGDATAMKRSSTGEDVTLSDLGKNHTDVRIFVELSEAYSQKITVTMTLGAASGGGWLDKTTGLTWENPMGEHYLDFDAAKSHCSSLGDGWRVPTISELRSLVRGCPATATGGTCEVTDSCLGYETCFKDFCNDQCIYRGGPGEGGCYWDPALNTCNRLISVSEMPDHPYYEEDVLYFIDFDYGTLGYVMKSSLEMVRCVK